MKNAIIAYPPHLASLRPARSRLAFFRALVDNAPVGNIISVPPSTPTIQNDPGDDSPSRPEDIPAMPRIARLMLVGLVALVPLAGPTPRAARSTWPANSPTVP